METFFKTFPFGVHKMSSKVTRRNCNTKRDSSTMNFETTFNERTNEITEISEGEIPKVHNKIMISHVKSNTIQVSILFGIKLSS